MVKLVHGETRSGKEGGGRKVAGRESGSAASLLALLPNEFTTADLIKLRAREEIIEISGICDKTFYAIRDRLKDLCDDV